MKLRELENKDAPLMYEWMQDNSITGYLKADFTLKTISGCVSFIENSRNDYDNLHLAIVDDNDEYMGTCSLKHIDTSLGIAEFGIVIRKAAMGTGLAAKAMKGIIDYGEDSFGLKQIYWCVDGGNERAIRFYDKNGYKRIDIMDYEMLMQTAFAKGGYCEEEIRRYIWYLY